jgi:hypothetical protein
LWIVHNILRIAFVHFGARRFERVIEAHKQRTCFAQALALVVQGEALQARQFMHRHASRDDDAFFERFGDICH